MIRGKDFCGYNSQELDIGYRQLGSNQFSLGIIKCIGVLGDALCRSVKPNHLRREIDEL